MFKGKINLSLAVITVKNAQYDQQKSDQHCEHNDDHQQNGSIRAAG